MAKMNWSKQESLRRLERGERELVAEDADRLKTTSLTLVLEDGVVCSVCGGELPRFGSAVEMGGTEVTYRHSDPACWRREH